MQLTTKMLQDFVNAVVYKPEKPTESVFYGTYNAEDESVIFDGADISTPVILTTEVTDGARVIVTIRDSAAYVTGILGGV